LLGFVPKTIVLNLTGTLTKT